MTSWRKTAYSSRARRHENKLYDIKDTLYYSVLDQLTDMGVLSVTLSGGEPMTHPQFLEFLKAAQEKDFSVNVLSNLTLLNDDIVRAMKEIRLLSVQVSLYSMIPEHHDAITTVKGSFEKTRDAILKLVKSDFVERCNSLCFDPARRLCGVGISSVCMVANGNVYPCAGWQECVCGNVAETPLKTIWDNSEKFKRLRSPPRKRQQTKQQKLSSP